MSAEEVIQQIKAILAKEDEQLEILRQKLPTLEKVGYQECLKSMQQILSGCQFFERLRTFIEMANEDEICKHEQWLTLSGVITRVDIAHEMAYNAIYSDKPHNLRIALLHMTPMQRDAYGFLANAFPRAIQERSVRCIIVLAALCEIQINSIAWIIRDRDDQHKLQKPRINKISWQDRIAIIRLYFFNDAKWLSEAKRLMCTSNVNDIKDTLIWWLIFDINQSQLAFVHKQEPAELYAMVCMLKSQIYCVSKRE